MADRTEATRYFRHLRLNRKGTIRFVLPGMEDHEADGVEERTLCVDDMARIRAAIERLIAE